MSKVLGFVGIGRMGLPMASRLLDAGYQLAIFDTSEAAMAPLLARGARRCASAAEVASAADIVLASLPTPDVVKKVCIGEGGIIAGNRVRLLVDLSTTGPKVANEVAEEFQKGGRTAVDAPVSGGVGGAEKGTLAVMASCPTAVYEELKPILSCIGKPFHVGEKPGLGQSMKLCNNILSACALVITAESMAMGVKAGLDPQLMLDVINAGSGRNSATEQKFPKSVLTRKFDFGFAMQLLQKDVRLCVEEAEQMGVPMPVGAAVRQMLSIAAAEYGGNADITHVASLLEKWAGVEIKGA